MSPDERRFRVLKARIGAEIRNLVKTEGRLKKYSNLLGEIRRTGSKDPLVEEADVCILMGAVLDDWYLAVENIFKIIAIEIDGGIPSGKSWHKDLLIQVSQEIASVGALIAAGAVWVPDQAISKPNLRFLTLKPWVPSTPAAKPAVCPV